MQRDKPHTHDTDQIAQDYAWLWMRLADDPGVFPIRATVRPKRACLENDDESMLKRLEKAGLVKIVSRKEGGFEIEIYHMSKRNVGKGMLE